MKEIRFLTYRRKKTLNILISSFLVCIIVTLNVIYFTENHRSTSDFSYFYSAFNNEIESSPETGGKLAIIIDDFGQGRDGVKEMMSIDRHLTFAVMPFLDFTRSDSELAHEKGYEIIVHLPMESTSGHLSWVGPRPILTAMNDNDIQRLVIDAFESVPYAVGANIHMGSKASNDERVISDILDIIKVKGLYFVDSRTSKYPVAKKVADEKGILCFERNIFLDGKISKEAIKKQLSKAADTALKRGKAVAIGHVGTEGGKVTAQAITEMFEEFENKKVKLVYVSELSK